MKSEMMVAPATGIQVQPGSAAEASQFIRMAMERDTPASELKALFELYERMTAAGQKTAFDKAMTQFQADCPPMPRGHVGNFTRVNASGVTVKARYSDLSDIAKTIAPALRANGLSYDWEETELVESCGLPCYRAHIRIRHENGYSERKSGPPIPMGKPITTRDGREVQSAPIHATAVITTAQRLALRSAFGLTSIDQDEEDATTPPARTAIDENQSLEIEDLIHAAAERLGTPNAADTIRRRMLDGLGVALVAEIPAEKFNYVCEKLEATGVKK